MSYPGGKHFLAAVTAPLHRKRKQDFTLPILKPATAKDIVLVVSPHPDDETFFAGGYILAALMAKAEVYVVLVSDGNKKGHSQERITEFQKALRLLGVPSHNLLFYLMPDASIIKNEEKFREKFAETYKEIKPTIVVGPHVHDKHSDHRVIAQILAEEVTCTSLCYLTHFPPRFPYPRKHDPTLQLLPPKKLASENWKSFPLTKQLQEKRRIACKAYARELKTPTLRSLLLAFDRTNELFSVRNQSK